MLFQFDSIATRSQTTKMSQYSAHRVRAVDRFRDDLYRVKLSDITYPLVMSGFFSKEDLSEILANPTNDQMKALLKVLESLLAKLQNPKQDEVWECFIWALHNDYSNLALNLALACDKGRKKLPGKISKLDIGPPEDFKHLVSFSGSKSAEVNMTDFQDKMDFGTVPPLSPSQVLAQQPELSLTDSQTGAGRSSL